MFDFKTDDQFEFAGGYEGSDLLIVNNGDGEWGEPVKRDVPVTHDEGTVEGPFILIGLMLPAIQSIEDPFEIF